ncbi:hypothetical protein IQ268_26960 [Oculatella sp. LEGE 06141]|nr:hypothetical protein [Oculatella sp. LEGE 06141]
MTALTGRYSNRQITPEEQKLYDHLLYWIELEPPAEMLERFRLLFIDGTRYPDSEITEALDKVTASKLAPEEFRYVLNRCCHILINRWQSRSSFVMAIPHLIRLFEAIPPFSVTGIPRARSVRRLRDLVTLFTQSEQYLTLCRLAQVLTEAAEVNTTSGTRPLGTLIRRYPYLYEHCLLSDDSTREHQLTVRQIQATMQRKFEIDLSQYVTYRVRSQLAAQPNPSQAQRIIQPVTNPTLLADQDLSQALKHYVGRVEGSRTHRDLAHHFLSHSRHTSSYQAFKDDLYQYITASVDAEYGKRQFNNQLYAQLKSMLPDSNSQPLNDFLLVRTCSQLLNFLIVDNPAYPNHFVFVDLVMNLGPISTTGLLLKIVLLSRTVKPYLERRFSILFNHYEAYTRDAVVWLIEALENLNLALSAHFGAIDLSFIR